MAKPLYKEPHGHVPHYEPYMHSTLAEVDLIEEVIGSDQAKLILDLGCNVGERSLELSRRGYLVVGLDLSEPKLEMARKKAEAEHLSVQFVRGDARSLIYKGQFDVALLLEHDVVDRHILKKVCRALKPEGTLILTAPNLVDRPAHSSNGFEPRPQSFPETIDLAETRKILSRAELTALLYHLGFVGIEFFAVTESGSRRDVPPAEDRENWVIAVKDSSTHPHCL